MSIAVKALITRKRRATAGIVKSDQAFADLGRTLPKHLIDEWTLLESAADRLRDADMSVMEIYDVKTHNGMSGTVFRRSCYGWTHSSFVSAPTRAELQL